MRVQPGDESRNDAGHAENLWSATWIRFSASDVDAGGGAFLIRTEVGDQNQARDSSTGVARGVCFLIRRDATDVR